MYGDSDEEKGDMRKERNWGRGEVKGGARRQHIVRTTLEMQCVCFPEERLSMLSSAVTTGSAVLTPLTTSSRFASASSLWVPCEALIGHSNVLAAVTVPGLEALEMKSTCEDSRSPSQLRKEFCWGQRMGYDMDGVPSESSDGNEQLMRGLLELGQPGQLAT